MPQTLYDRIWEDHIVARLPDGTALIGIDRHLIHEVTSPQAFEGLQSAGRAVRRPDLSLAVADHNVPTEGRGGAVADPESAVQIALLERNAAREGIEHVAIDGPGHGIVHVIGPEQGFTLPGTTIVCGDSHTSTHGAFGALGFGIGTSEIEHVLATQTLLLRKARNMRVEVSGRLGTGISAKDLALALIGRIRTAGATGHVIEFSGEAVRALSMEARMTLCNLAIEAGARSGLVAPDDTTFAYLHGRPRAPRGEAWEAAVRWWRTLRSDDDAAFDRVVEIDAIDIVPTVTWGTSPEQAVRVDAVVPDPGALADASQREAARRALDYMGLAPGTPMTEVAIDNVFIGSCTNSRIEDLRAAAAILRGRRVHADIRQALVVPGSAQVKSAAEAEGLDRVFRAAGFDWREAGCSMCLGMNPDRVPSGERCASTSNRNFVGRQGPGARTHLMSPAMAAAAAVAGRIVDVRAFGDAA